MLHNRIDPMPQNISLAATLNGIVGALTPDNLSQDYTNVGDLEFYQHVSTKLTAPQTLAPADISVEYWADVNEAVADVNNYRQQHQHTENEIIQAMKNRMRAMRTNIDKQLDDFHKMQKLHRELKKQFDEQKMQLTDAVAAKKSSEQRYHILHSSHDALLGKHEKLSRNHKALIKSHRKDNVAKKKSFQKIQGELRSAQTTASSATKNLKAIQEQYKILQLAHGNLLEQHEKIKERIIGTTKVSAQDYHDQLTFKYAKLATTPTPTQIATRILDARKAAIAQDKEVLQAIKDSAPADVMTGVSTPHQSHYLFSCFDPLGPNPESSIKNSPPLLINTEQTEYQPLILDQSTETSNQEASESKKLSKREAQEPPLKRLRAEASQQTLFFQRPNATPSMPLTASPGLTPLDLTKTQLEPPYSHYQQPHNKRTLKPGSQPNPRVEQHLEPYHRLIIQQQSEQQIMATSVQGQNEPSRSSSCSSSSSSSSCRSSSTGLSWPNPRM